jgi:maltooligosyltrehalose trehalohydrolase
VPEAGRTAFRVWAPEARRVRVVLDGGREAALAPAPDGFWEAVLPAVFPGDLYRFRVDDREPFPDPASRFQPRGVHGPSQVVDPSAFRWKNGARRRVHPGELVFYELHTGTFTPEGTFLAAAGKIPFLKDLGVTALQLMPVADFPGDRNWGYDGVSLFAPARRYGGPDDLRRLVDRAHGAGLAVFLDVVYNHFGPDGNYTGLFSPYYLSPRHKNPWGAAPNLDGPHSRPVRDFFIENAFHWLHEYRLDGLRLDATHALKDDGPVHFVAELAGRVKRSFPDGNAPLVIAEDERNDARIIRSARRGGWGLDALWADDLHHHLRSRLAGDKDGYYADYSGTAQDIAATLNRGWFYSGQRSRIFGQARGSDPGGLPKNRFVVCLQNHDQIGYRAFGERIHLQIEPAAHRAAAALLLGAPETPLLFMGQEWAASTPFLYFTDHSPALGRLITLGRREEFKRFAHFSSPAVRRRIPDPQSPATFSSSRLLWSERTKPGHRQTWRWYRSLLRLRRSEPALHGGAPGRAAPSGDEALWLRRGPFLLVVRLAGKGAVSFPAGRWTQRLCSEEKRFALDPRPPILSRRSLFFHRPGAVLFHRGEGGKTS